MYKKIIEFTDYNDEKRKEEHYFNLNQSEIIKWLTTTGDYTLDKVLERLSTERNGKKIIEIFENLIRLSYGRKSLDGRKFEKNEEIWNDFYQTEAYNVLFTELVTDAKKAAQFVNNIIPKDLADEVAKIVRENPNGLSDEMKDYVGNLTPNNVMTITQQDA